jgi:hypothetical protein
MQVLVLVSFRTNTTWKVNMAQQTGGSPQPSGDRQERSNDSARRSLKPIVLWVGGILTAVITAVAVGAATGYTSHLLDKKSTAVPKGPPLAVVSVTLQRNGAYQGGTYVFPDALRISSTQIHLIDSTNQQLGQDDYYDSWARAHGGVDPDTVIIQLILAGNRSYPVRILDMRPVGQCASRLKGTLLLSPTAGEDDSVLIGFNLDKPDPIADTYSQTRGFGQSFFESKTVTLTYPQQQVFEIVGQSVYHYCQFRIHVDMLSGNRKEVELIGNGSQPFKVSGILPIADYKEVYLGGVADNGCPGPADGFTRIDIAKYSHFKFAALQPCKDYLYRSR